MKKEGFCRRAIASLSLAALVAGAPLAAEKAFGASDKAGIKEPRVLEFDYKEGEVEDYLLTGKIKISTKGYANCSADYNFNISAKGEVIEYDEETSVVELKIQKVYAKIKGTGSVKGMASGSSNGEIKWDINDKDNPIAQQALEDAIFYFFIGKTGEISYNESENKYADATQIIDFFPDDAVKLGDKWNSEGIIEGEYAQEDKSEEDNINETALKLSGRAKHKGVDVLVIDFSGKKEMEGISLPTDSLSEEYETPLFNINGKLFYDPIKKKILKLDMKGYSDITTLLMQDDSLSAEENKKTKTKMHIGLEMSLKED
ncbi:MAG TPA: hypothetical protein VJA86_01315 [Candidatus Nanoarchaeia archaeon]|nr:hypothetical protein [Candidatus Nanoarchaeia archaeon]